MTKIVTFYSFKGGVGRTMALVNTAYVLARSGWRVLMVDFDLEAPGMTHFFANLIRERPERVRKDALDLLLHAKVSLNRGPRRASSESLSEYIINVPLPSVWLGEGTSEISYFNGCLGLLPATLNPVDSEDAADGVGGGYLQRMDSLNLKEIFSVGPGHGFGAFIRQLLLGARFEAPGDTVFTLREKIQAAYDLVLVDSRTGLNEVSGLCIGPLCDALVICCGLNHQNIEGTSYLMEAAGLLRSTDAKPFVVVAGPIPPWQSEVVGHRIERLKEALLANVVVRVPYHPRAALSETVFVKDESSDPIALAYEQLAPMIVDKISSRDAGEGFYRNARGNGGESRRGSRIVADHLAERRLPRQRREKLRGVLALFPSALTTACQPLRPQKGLWQQLRLEDVGPVSLAAAVAAYRRKSEEPFERAYRLNAPEEVRRSLKVRLDFFKFLVLGRFLSKTEVDDLVKQARRVKNETWEKWIHYEWPELCANLDVLVAAIRFLDKQDGKNAVRLELIKALAQVTESESISRRVFPFHVQSSGPWSQIFSLLAGRSGLEDLADFERLKLQGLISSVRPIEPLSELFENPKDLWPSLNTRVFLNVKHFDLDTHVFMALDSWPEFLMVSALALLKGESAKKEILGWLALARWNYGFAWRVLANWHHLRVLEEDADFRQLIALEDREIEKIESEIDKGVYSL